jgi:hypothetical protein
MPFTPPSYTPAAAIWKSSQQTTATHDPMSATRHHLRAGVQIARIRTIADPPGLDHAAMQNNADIARIPLRERHGECFRKCCRGRWTQRRRTPKPVSRVAMTPLPFAMVGRHGREPLPPTQRSAADTPAGDAAPGQQVAGQCSRHPTQADQQPGPAHAGQRVPYGGVTGDSSQPCAAPTYSSTARTVSTINSGSASTAPGRHRRIGVTLPAGRRRLIRGYLVTALLTSFGPSYSRSGMLRSASRTSPRPRCHARGQQVAPWSPGSLCRRGTSVP